METIGSGAVTASFAECASSDVIIVIGANPTVNHPVAATFIKNAAKRGAKLIVIDPRRQALSRHATHHLAFRPGTDVALLNALIHTIIDEGLYDPDYIAQYTAGLRGAARAGRGLLARGDGADLRHRRRRRSATVARLYAHGAGGDHLLGHGDLAARPRHRQRPLPDRAGAPDRPGRPAGHRPAPAPRARTTCRGRPTPA